MGTSGRNNVSVSPSQRGFSIEKEENTIYDKEMKQKQSIPMDRELNRLIQEEEKRQETTVNLIASENKTPESVREVLSSVTVNKYSEGYGAQRYYPGTRYVNAIEDLSHKRTRTLFGLNDAWHINTQAYSGAIANAAIYNALLKPGDTILSMDLKAGGHLSHGASVSAIRKLYTVEHYGVNDHYRIDYAEVERLAQKHKPAIIVSGASAYPFVIDFRAMGKIAKAVGAYHLADISHYAGLIVAGLYPSPFPYADVVMTTTHKSLWGPRGAIIMANTKSSIARAKTVSIADAVDHAVFPGLQGGPHMHTIAAIAAGLRLAHSARFRSWARRVKANAETLAQELIKKGLCVVGGGTESHCVLVDVRPLGMHGGQAQELLEQKGILVNKNAIAGDASVRRPSAIRMGTYWITSDGANTSTVRAIAQSIASILLFSHTNGRN